MNDLVPLMSRRMLALIMIVLTVLVAGVGAQAQTTTDIKINFMPTDTPPTGYEADTGASYGLRDNGLTYGWLSVNTNQPFDASVNARDRDTGAPTLDDTLMHLRYNECCPDGGNGTQEPVYWEIAVPNGTYSVVVSVGDENNESTIETSHQIAAEGVVIADGSGGLSPFEYPAQNVNVSDGRLTIDQALSGFNTKINYIEITATSVTPVDTPSIADVRPANGATNVFRDTSIATDLALVNGNGGVQASTLTDANVYLREQGSSTNIPAGLNTTGGFDAIVLVPSVPLEANTTYEFTVTQNVTDQAGVPFELFTSTFTTGTEFERQYDGSIEFEQVSAGASPGNYSSLEVGPDGKLYGSTINGNLLRWDINPDGTLSNQETIISLSGRAVVGMTHDPNSTAANPIVWISHATFGFSNMPDWGSKISKVTNINTNPTVQDVVVDLPRSAKDHLSNSLTFKDGMLYLIQGSNSAMGAPDGAWSNRPERALNAAVIQIDVNAISGTLNVKTEDGGTYDPFAENAPVTVWASGIRNAYDLVWHSNGSLYVPTNGSASGGNSPGTPNPLPDICNERIDGLPYTGGSVPAANSIETQNDYLFRAEQGGYYGHPNPTRCEWVLNGGNPTSSTDPAQVNKYPVGVQPDPNYRGFAFDFGKSQSPNGVIEYQNNAFGGALQGQLIVTRYSSGNDLIVLEPNNLDGTGNGDIQNAVTGIDGFTGLSNPLDLTEDVTTGNIYVSEYGSNQLTLLRPLDSSSAPDIRVSAEQLIFEDQLAGSSSYVPAVNPRTVTVSNFGTSPLTLETLSITDTGATRYTLPSGLSLPAVVNPGDTLDIDVTFTAQTKGVEVASLNIGSDDPDTPLASVELRGLGKQGLGGSNEPSLQHVLDAFDIDVDTGDNDPATNVISSDTSSSNMNSLLGDEVPVQLFEKAGTGSVTVEPLAVYGPTSADPVTIVGWYSAETDAETTLFSVDNTPSTNGQRLLPDVNGTTSFNPGSDAFGFYSQWPFFSNRKLYSEDAKNTFSGNIPHHVRVYELPGEANAYIVATEEHVSGFDYQDVVFIVRNVKPASGSGEINLVNAYWSTLSDQGIPELDYLNRWLTMSRMNSLDSSNQKFVDQAMLRIENTSTTEPLQIFDLQISDTTEFDLPNGEDTTVPLTIPAGGSYDLLVEFIESSGGKGVRQRTLTITSSAKNEPVAVVTLAGAYMTQPEGGNEVTADHIAESFGLSPDSQGRNLIPLSSDYTARYEEVLSYRWQRADTSQPMYVHQIAAFHGGGNVGFNVSGSGGDSHGGDYHQSLLPATTNTTNFLNNPTQQLFNSTNSTFTFTAAGYSTDDCEGVTNCNAHGMRLWPLYNPDGELIPNTYYAIQDYVQGGCGAGSANCDYNDNVYLITNLAPVTMPPPDLQIALATEDEQVAVGQSFDYTLTVSNETIFNAENVTVTDTLPAGFTLVVSSFGNNETCAESGGTVTCDLGTMAGKSTVEITLTVSAANEGINIANVASVDADDFGGASSETVWVTVVDPDNLPGSITVILDADPDSETEFTFNNTMDNTPFVLIDDGSAQGGDTIQINFNEQNGQQPSGYELDFGEAFGDRGNSYNYGWVNASDGTTPLDLTANGRDRGTSQPDQRLDTLVHMQGDDVGGFNGTAVEGFWEITLPNGFYEVTAAVGDPDVNNYAQDPELHALRVEGVTAIQPFAPQGSAGSDGHHQTATVTVEVTDGRLTLDAIGGTNSKINYVDITPQTFNNQKTFATVLPGEHDITEVIPTDWDLTDMTCNAASYTTGADGVTIDLQPGEDVTCTFTNEGDVTVPLAIADIPDQSMESDDTLTLSFGITPGSAGLETETLSVTGSPAIDFASPVTAAVQPDTYQVTFSPDAGDVGTYTVTVFAEDFDNNSTTETFTLTVTPDSGDAPCAPISTLPCDQIATNLPFSLDWDGDEGGLDDSGGTGTGFSMAMAPSSRLSADDPVTFPGVAEGYEPSYLTVADGNLAIDATKGIFYRDNGTSSNTNSQLNGLGVGVNLTDAVVIETTVTGTDFTPGGSNAQQGGIWFGLDEDNVAKLVVFKTGDTNAKIQLQVEDYLSNGNIQPEELNTGNIGDPATLTVTLRMVVDPTTGAVTGFYSTDGTTFTPVIEGGEDTLTAGTGFLAGDDHDGSTTSAPLSYAGVFSTIRNDSAPITFNFADFSIDWLNPPTPEPGSITIVKDTQPDDDTAFDFDGDLGTFSLTDSGTSSTPVPDGDPIVINFQLDTAPIPDGFLPDTGAAYGDRGNSYTYGWLDFTGDVLTGTPVDASTAARDRNRGGIAQELDTIMHMQRGDVVESGGWLTPVYWEIALPNGFYDVTVSVGDEPGSGGVYDSQHQLRLEGTPLFNAPQQLDASQEYVMAGATVEVTDGALTMDPLGGFNTKPTYIEIQPLTTPAAGQTSVTFNDLDAGSYVVTELASTGWQLDDVTCTGDVDNGSALSGNTLTVDLDDAEDIVCTFVNIEAVTNTAPEALAQSVTVDENDSMTITLQGTDVDTGDTLTYAIDTPPSNGTLDTSNLPDVLYTPDIDYVGSDSFDFVVNDGTEDSAPATVSITVEPAAATPCAPISTLPCDQIAASLPFSLDWDGDEGGLDDSGGMGTGFSMAMAPSSRLSADDPVTFPGVAEGYEPRQLTVANGNLSIEATKGIFYRDNGTSSNTNSQLNGLGVGVSVTDAIVIETTVSETDFTPDGNNSQQGGIWFGLDEDNVAKLVVAKTADNNAKIQLQIEDYLSNGNIQPEELNTGNIGNPVSLDITLRMVVDPATGAVTGFYSTDGTTFTPVIEGGEDTLMVGTDFFAGDDHDADAGTTPLSYAGVFSTIRNGSTPITFNFADFSIDWLNPPVPEPGSITIVKDTQPDDDTAFDFDGDLGTFSLTDSGASSTPVPDGDPIAINFQEDGAPIPADFLPDTGAAYGDRGNSYTYGWLDFTGDTLTDAPIDASAAARDRNRGGIAQELDTLIHMQLGDVSTGSWTTPIYWEIELPNGFYEVTVSVGDQPGGDGYDSQHQVRLEGSPLFNAPQQLDASQEYATATATVEVTDGVLTMDPLGGFNTKPNYIEIQPLTTPAAGQPSVTFDDLDAGSYAVTELASADWQLDDVTCTGDLDNGSTLSGNTLTVDLDEAEDIVCTFVNVEAPTNTAPEAIAQSVTVDENGSITITLQGTDADTGDTLSYTIVDLPDNGSITSLVGNQAVYEPSTDYVGSDSFDFVVNDGTADSAPATVSITVEAVNTAPQALAQSVTVDENGSITITLQGTDADTGDTLSYAITNLPDNGSITSLVGNQAVYQPSTDYVGSDSFDFVVNDGTENSAPATVSITVEAVDTPPALAAIDDITVDEGELVSFVASATDDNQALLSMEIAITDVGGSPVNIGTFTDNGNGLADFIWQTDSTSAGVYTATVTATDDQSNQDTETLTITVNDVPIDEAPILASISDVFVSEGQTVNVSISATDDDEVADAIALAVSAPTISGYSFTDNGNGTASFSWTTDSNSAGTYTVNVTATDDGNNQDTETFTIYVSDVPVDEAPQIASIDDVTVDEGELVRVVIDAQDFDQVPDAISLTLNVGGLDASEYIFSDNNGAGVFLWATDSDDAGTYPVTVTATDTGGNATQETFQIIVNNVEVTATPTPTDDPGSQELIRINAGGPQVTTESGTWSADIFFSGGVANGGLSTSVTTPQDEIIYLTERSASSASTGFNYAIPVNGTDYTVKLHFAEIWFSGVNSYRPAESGQRVFDVEIEGQTALDDLDIIDSVGTTTALVETFDVTVTDGTLNINFPPAAENRPQIAGIEVIGDAVVTPEPTETATLEPTETETSTPEPTETSTPEPTETETSTPEPTETATPEPDTVIRINTGGLQVTTESGVWSADTYFVGGQSGATVPNVTAAQDEAIYLTERSATSDNNGFAYAIPVSNGTHTLRLHFAEIWFTDQAGNATGGVGKRVFDVQIEGQTQIDDLDIYATVGSQTAHIETFTVQVTDGVLNIDFPPASSDRPQIAGIEVIEGPTSTPEPTETETETSTPEPTETETSTPEPTVTETETSTPEPTETETETSTPEPTETETETSTPEPTETETETSTPEPTETETETSTPEPTETAIRINAGGPEVTTESGTWSADTFFTSGVPGTTVTSVTASQDEAIYLTERSTNSDSAGFAYAIPVSNGTHTLRLHFAEIWYTDQLGNSTGGADKRVFDVQVEGQTVIDDLDIYATVGSQVAHIETFTVTVTDGVLDITFPPASANRPQVAGIEVLSTSNVTPEPTETETSTPEPTETETSTPEPTETETSTPEPTETETSTPEPTETETSTPEPTETETSTPEPTETETETSTPEPTETETSTPEPTETETSTPEPTETETETSTPEPTETEAPTPAVVSFTLIDAENDTPLQVIGDGSTINLSALPTTQLNIRADVNPAAADQVGSVSFTLSGAETYNHVENIVPYALFWDFDGDYQTWTPTLGTYTLQATPHSSDGASGTAGTSLTVNFTIIDTASPSSNGTAGTVQSLQQLSQGRSPAPPPTTDNTVEAFSGSVSVEPLRSQEQDNE